MYQAHDEENTIPRQWIGVSKNWQLSTSDPFEQLVSLIPEHLATHMLAIGGTGSGKTTLLQHLIAQDIERNHSLVVLDLRGDLVESVINICSVAEVDPERIRIIDLREKRRPFGYNPLHGAGDPYFRALNVLQVLEEESESWGVQLGESVRSCLMLLSEAGEPITRLEDLFYDEDFLTGCMRLSRTQSVLRYWDRFLELSPTRRLSMVWPVVNKVSTLLATETLRKVLGHPEPIDVGRHLNTKGSIFLISLAVDELHGAGRMLGSLLLSSISREIFGRAGQSGATRNPVRVYVDEFEHFVADFETILAEGRRFGLSLVLAHQTLAQLTPKMRSLILNNVGVKFAFRCGREDAPSLCRDMTGDPHAVDLNDLPPGEALMWVRGYAPELVEINEPMSALRKTSRSMAYREALFANAKEFALEVRRDGDVQSMPFQPHLVLEESPERPSKPRKTRRGNQAAALEEWLCG